MGKPCRKRKLRTRTEAMIVLRKMKNTQLDAYYCDQCKAWHTGSSKEWWRKMDRINQILNRVLPLA